MAILPGPVIVIDLDHDRGRENVLQGCYPYMRRLVYNPAIYVHIYIYAYSSGGRQHSAALRPLQLQVRQGGLATHNKELNRYKYLTMYAHIYISLSLSFTISLSFILFVYRWRTPAVSSTTTPGASASRWDFKKVPFNYQSFHLARLAAHDAAPGVPSFAIHSVCVHVGMAVI